MIGFNYIYNKLERLSDLQPDGVKFPYLPKLNSIIGNIVSNQLYVIAGDTGFGKSEFMDFHFLYNILMSWHLEGDRDDIKILYFSTKTKEEVKYLKLMSSFMWLNSGLRVDVPTLLNRANKKTHSKEDILSAADLSKAFFVDVEIEEVLDIFSGEITIPLIENEVYKHFSSIGEFDDDNSFTLNDDSSNLKTYIFINGADFVSTNVEGTNLTRNDTNSSLASILTKFKSYPNTSVIITVDTENVKYIKKFREVLPSYKDIGIWSKHCDVGIVIFDPIKSSALKLLNPSNPDASVYVRNGVSLLKYWFIVSNSNGADLLYNKMLTLPGSNFSFEIDNDAELNDIVDTLELIHDKENLYV